MTSSDGGRVAVLKNLYEFKKASVLTVNITGVY
jgi:hypothetical protein